MKRFVKISSLTIVILFSLFWILIEFPSVLFENKHENENLVIHSDQAFQPNINNLSEEVLSRLKKSDLFDKTRTYNVYIVQGKWRWLFLANRINKVGGFAMGFNGNAFVRPSDIENNIIIHPNKNLLDMKERDLLYFLTHELSHIMMYDKFGYVSNFVKFPNWLREGYPDYIGKASFDFEENLKQFKNNEKRLTVESGMYVRYHLYVYYLMSIKGQSIEEIAKEVPDESKIEELLRDLEL